MSDAQSQSQSLMTRWAAEVTTDNVLPEYPRPQMTRERWLNLNGLWEYATTNPSADQPASYNGKILVPFPIESALSGVQQRVDGKWLWYRRTASLPANWAGQRVLLHFGAVDWRMTVWVNGNEIGTHTGGYDPFSFDITDALEAQGEQELVVVVWDPSDEGTQPRGKQVRDPHAIWYTPTTGIWQTVWLEPVPSVYIDVLKLEPDIDKGVLKLQASLGGDHAGNYSLKAEAFDGGNVIASNEGNAESSFEVSIDNAKLWSPESPFLYDLRVTILRDGAGVDQVMSYFGMRKTALQIDSDGTPRLWLNNQPIFHFGLLDQGFWPDGLYTPPTDEALRYDIEITQQLGFNMIRKHVKIEPQRWYYWTDRMGVLVWQDMPSGDASVRGGEGEIERSEQSADQFELELHRMIDSLFNHPSIVMWVIFNEGWGQYDTARITDWAENYDPSRPINSVTGWNDVGVGAVHDIHSYPGPDMPEPDGKRAMVLGEFGGLGLPLQGHTWVDSNNWGYKAYEDSTALLQAYRELMEKLRVLVQTRGLAAAVYTQTTDVETEVNGMITYDRELMKMDAEQVRAINLSIYNS